jgi:hypothetical protein
VDAARAARRGRRGAAACAARARRGRRGGAAARAARAARAVRRHGGTAARRHGRGRGRLGRRGGAARAARSVRRGGAAAHVENLDPIAEELHGSPRAARRLAIYVENLDPVAEELHGSPRAARRLAIYVENLDPVAEELHVWPSRDDQARVEANQCAARGANFGSLAPLTYMDPNSSRFEKDIRLARFLRKHHSAVGIDELRRLGFAKDAVTELLAREQLLRVHRGSYRAGAATPTAETFKRCALLTVGDDAMLGRASAAHQRGYIDFAPPEIQVAVNRSGARRRRKGLNVFYAHGLQKRDGDRADDLMCTKAHRTMIDLAAVTRSAADYKLLRRAVRQATVRHRTLPESLERTIRDRGAFRGSRVLSAILDEHLDTTAMLRSDLEDAFLDLCRSAGIPLPETNAVVEGFEVDAVWRLERVIAELDTYDYHGDIRAFERDRARDAVLMVAGYRPIRITGRRLSREPDRVIDQTKALLGLPRR